MSREPWGGESAGVEEGLHNPLRNALRREHPSASFAGRVLALAAARRRKRIAQTWMAIAAMFVVAAFVTAGLRSYEAHRQAESRQAGRQLLIALKITGSKLQTTTRLMHLSLAPKRRTNGV